MWIVKHIMEADFGCEERAENEPLMVLVTIESDDGRMMQFEAEDAWIAKQDIDEGDEWQDDVDAIETDSEKALNMSGFMEKYYSVVEEMEQG